jgi:hypothetical protein
MMIKIPSTASTAVAFKKRGTVSLIPLEKTKVLYGGGCSM